MPFKRCSKFVPILFCAFTTVFFSCGGEGNSSQEYAKWTFSGYVIDGATNERLAGAQIEYLDEDGEMAVVEADSSSAFYITSLPYGQKVFRFSCIRIHDKDTVRYGERMISASSGSESSLMEGVLANGSRLIKLYPLSAGVKGQAMLRVAGSGKLVPAKDLELYVQYRDTSFVNTNPDAFHAETDSLGQFEFESLPADTNLWLTATTIDYNGTRYLFTSKPFSRLSTDQVLDIGRLILEADTLGEEGLQVLASNVLDQNGMGLVGIPLDLEPYYVLNQKLDPDRLDLQVLVGDSSINASAQFRGDTLFVQHQTPFKANSYVEVQIRALVDDTYKQLSLSLSGSARFKTGQALKAIASNTWGSNEKYRTEFAVGDTLWVRYSSKLGDVSSVQWSRATTGKTLFGSGLSTNSKAWIHEDTLFVMPDQRLEALAGERIAFVAAVKSESGELSNSMEFYTTLASASVSMQWTNAKDAAGTMRSDLGVLDSIVVVSNKPLKKVVGVTTTDSASLPFGFMPSDVTLRGKDTIVFKPSIALTPGTLYGMDFDVQTEAGVNLVNVLPVRWKTAYQVKIISVNNRENTGYRRFKALGDSLEVQFSKPINTSSSSSVPFKVNMVDVNGKTVQTAVTWNNAKTIATIKNITPFPMADFGINTTTTTAGDKARAVNGVTFDFETTDGEVIYGLKPESEPIKIYTEEGLCVLNTNVLKSHSSNYDVGSAEVPVTNFDVTSAVTVTFNRTLDTTAMKAGSLSGFASLQTGLGATVTATVTFADAGKTIVIKPTSNLGAAGEYWIRLYKIPALGLGDAGAIGKYGGTFSGSSTTSNYLLINGFGTP